jgi:hypothetical protein
LSQASDLQNVRETNTGGIRALPNGHPPKIQGVEYDSQGFPKGNLISHRSKSITEVESCLRVTKLNTYVRPEQNTFSAAIKTKTEEIFNTHGGQTHLIGVKKLWSAVATSMH